MVKRGTPSRLQLQEKVHAVYELVPGVGLDWHPEI